ncbi:MAG: class II aldolase/adducin family protein [Anaerolineae bacterium]|nr:class II aldolase/adducin family protein [Anaerolineae bacterium]
MKLDQLHPCDQLVAIMGRIYHNRLTTLSGGNLSIKDADGHIWITPAATDKGQMVPEDIVCVRAGGSVEGRHPPSSELPFHRAIYARRPDLGAIVHAHPPALVTFSIAHQIPDTCIVPHAWQICGRAGYAPYALTGSQQLGDAIAATFAAGHHVVLLENHGAAAAGPDLLTAYHRLETLEFHARTLLNARRVGSPAPLTAEQLSLAGAGAAPLPAFMPAEPTIHEIELRRQAVHAIHRACDRFLMTGTQGVLSARFDAHSFLITPAGLDRRTLEVDDLVLIRNGQRAAGKVPSQSMPLHAAIYEAHPQIACVIEACPPNAMAYAVSGALFDTRTIPESYILLRDVPLVPYGIRFSLPEKVARALSLNTPVLLLQNDAVLTAGHTILAALDRLEVAEFTAESLINATALGELVPIDEQGIADLKARFHL